MPELILLGIVIIALAIAAIRERRRWGLYCRKAPGWYSDANYREGIGNGQWRDYLSPITGQTLDAHESCHREQAAIYRAAEICNQRQCGRFLGRSIVVSWTPGKDPQVDNEARWIRDHGASVGVYIREVR